MTLSIIKAVIVLVALFIAFSQAENKSKTLIASILVLLCLELVSIRIDYNKNKPSFVFVSQKRFFADNIPTGADFTFEFKNLGGREAKDVNIIMETFLDGESMNREALPNKKNIVPLQSIYPRLGLSSNACNEVFNSKKRLTVKIIIKHKESSETKYLGLDAAAQTLNEAKWKIIEKI